MKKENLTAEDARNIMVQQPRQVGSDSYEFINWRIKCMAEELANFTFVYAIDEEIEKIMQTLRERGFTVEYAIDYLFGKNLKISW